MQAEQNNYQPDKQFTDQAWNEMLKTLDQEMPVEEKKRRGFFWLFPMLLIGMVAGVWAFYPENKKEEITQSREVVLDENQNSKLISESKIGTQNKNITTENKLVGNKTVEKKTTETKETTTRQIRNIQTKVNDDFPSIMDSANPLLPPVIEELIPLEKTKVVEEKKPLAKLKITIQPINSSFITIDLQNENEHLIERKNIISPLESIESKTEFGVFAGVVTDFASIQKVGLTSGAFVQFPIDKKIGLRTGLGYTQLQKNLPYSFIESEDAAFSSEFNDVATTSLIPFSSVAVESKSIFVLEKFHQLDLPVLLTYAPLKKFQIQLGANFSYLIKEKTRLFNNVVNIDNSVNDDYSNYGIALTDLNLNSISPNQYSNENYWTKLNVNGVVGLAWKPGRRINLELQYHQGFLPILKTNESTSSGLLQDSRSVGYEVISNFGVIDPDISVQNESYNRVEKAFNKDRFRKYNYSLRFTIGYNF